MRIRPAATLLAATLFSALAGCGAAPDVADVESALTRCDAYNELVCADDGPTRKNVCWCELKAGYDCDPLTDKGACSGQQPQKCVAGRWQNNGAVCPNRTMCSSGACVTPPPPAPG